MTQASNSRFQDPKTPPDVEIRFEARKPNTDPTLGIAVNIPKIGNHQHRLVTIGDSLTHGFQSGAIFNTSLSYPAIIAKEMGWKEIRYPVYSGPQGGLPLNLEYLSRDLKKRFGDKINWSNGLQAILSIRSYLDAIEDYWERGKGSVYDNSGKINHNLAVYGWDLRNTLSRNADICLDVLVKNPPKNDFLRQVIEYHNERAAAVVLNSARDSKGKALTPVQAAAELGKEGNGEGIETLIVMIGANNALGSILTLNVSWSDVGYDDMDVNDKYTVWRPTHFKAEFDLLAQEIKKIRARHVIVATVPHITIVPFARGVGGKAREKSRYFPYYTLPWIQDKDFNSNKHPCLTENEARAIDCAIDQYNETITEVVRQARNNGRDWYLLELCGLLDRLASRRYIEDPSARPNWWDEVGGQYQLSPELQAISPTLNSCFFRSTSRLGRTDGGLFSLDGIHPTTVGYGIMAQEIIKIMQSSGVKFYEEDGNIREGEVKVNWQRLIAQDSLVSQAPHNIDSVLDFVGGIDKYLNLFSGMLRRNY